MIKLSNGHVLKYMVASGALAFDGLGWFWERPLVWLKLLRPELFTVVIKSLTLHPRKGNLQWWKPWTCVCLIKEGAVNKVGLTNKGINWWCEKIAPKIDFEKYHIAGSIFGNKEELIQMAEIMNAYPLVALEVNYSCPNSGHGVQATEAAIEGLKAVAKVSIHPLIVKVSCVQDYLMIAEQLGGIAEAISINSVPWEFAFPDGEKSPLWKLEKKVQGGGGGVSGKPAQKCNWEVVQILSEQGILPVIAPSVMKYEDLDKVRKMGAEAISFGAIHMASHPVWLKPWTIFSNPLKPTWFVEKEAEQKQ